MSPNAQGSNYLVYIYMVFNHKRFKLLKMLYKQMYIYHSQFIRPS